MLNESRPSGSWPRNQARAFGRSSCPTNSFGSTPYCCSSAPSRPAFLTSTSGAVDATLREPAAAPFDGLLHHVCSDVCSTATDVFDACRRLPERPMEAHGPRRKLTTILCADCAGYSRMMRADEERTYRVLQECRLRIDGIIGGLKAGFLAALATASSPNSPVR